MQPLLAPLRWLINSSRRRRRLFYRTYRCSWPIARTVGAVYRRIALRRTRVIAVVGSFGKTTTTRAVTTALQGPGAYHPLGNYRTGLAHRLLETLPQDKYVALEVGINGPGVMREFAELIAPDIAVVTGIGSEHNTSLGTLEVTRREKSEMVRVLPANGIAVLNGDDPNVMWMADRTRARIVTYGFGPDVEVRASSVRLNWPHGTEFSLHVDGSIYEARTRLIGRPMVLAILAGVAVGSSLGVDVATLLRNMEALKPELGRLQPIVLPSGIALLRDDYKSALETCYAALDILEMIPASRRVVVLGDVAEPPGSQGDIHRQVGARVAEVADLAVFVGGGCSPYSSGAKRAGMPDEAVVKAGRDYRVATDFLAGELRPGDVVLIKGRNDQRLERVALALRGRPVGCAVQSCRVKGVRCVECVRLGPASRRTPRRPASRSAAEGAGKGA